MSSEQRPQRVRVTGPPRQARAGPRRRSLDEESALGRVYVASLVSAQGRLAAGVLVALVATVGSLPLLFALAPGLADVVVAGLPLGWLLPGVLVYPWLVLLAWLYVRRAERNEAHFADLVGGGSGTADDSGPRDLGGVR